MLYVADEVAVTFSSAGVGGDRTFVLSVGVAVLHWRKKCHTRDRADSFFKRVKYHHHHLHHQDSALAKTESPQLTHTMSTKYVTLPTEFESPDDKQKTSGAPHTKINLPKSQRRREEEEKEIEYVVTYFARKSNSPQIPDVLHQIFFIYFKSIRTPIFGEKKLKTKEDVDEDEVQLAETSKRIKLLSRFTHASIRCFIFIMIFVGASLPLAIVVSFDEIVFVVIGLTFIGGVYTPSFCFAAACTSSSLARQVGVFLW